MKNLKNIFITAVIIAIFTFPAFSDQAYPKIYINGKLFQGKTLITGNILYAEADELMKALNGTHLYNIPTKTHYINNKYYPSSDVFIYQNKFYLYLKTAAITAGANKATYNQGTNTIIIESGVSQTSTAQIENSENTNKTGTIATYQSVKTDEQGLTEHYQQNQVLDNILGEIKTYLYNTYSMQVPEAVQVVSVEYKELIHIANDKKLPDGLYICGLYWRSRIYLQYGLSDAQIYEVMAHEYTHAWQVYNCPWDQEEILREGFAEWIAYKYSKGKTSGSTFTDKGNTVYGKGLKFCLLLEAKSGEKAVFDYVKKNKKITD